MQGVLDGEAPGQGEGWRGHCVDQRAGGISARAGEVRRKITLRDNNFT